MMNVEAISPRDMPEIDSWHTARGLHLGGEGWYSDLGFWVPHTVAGWMLTTNSKRVLFEDWVSNPSVDKSVTKAAFELLENHMIAVARDLGFRYILGTTSLNAVRDKAKALGYHVTPQSFSYLFKDISK